MWYYSLVDSPSRRVTLRVSIAKRGKTQEQSVDSTVNIKRVFLVAR